MNFNITNCPHCNCRLQYNNKISFSGLEPIISYSQCYCEIRFMISYISDNIRIVSFFALYNIYVTFNYELHNLYISHGNGGFTIPWFEPNLYDTDSIRDKIKPYILFI